MVSLFAQLSSAGSSSSTLCSCSITFTGVIKMQTKKTLKTWHTNYCSWFYDNKQKTCLSDVQSIKYWTSNSKGLLKPWRWITPERKHCITISLTCEWGIEGEVSSPPKSEDYIPDTPHQRFTTMGLQVMKMVVNRMNEVLQTSHHFAKGLLCWPVCLVENFFISL